MGAIGKMFKQPKAPPPTPTSKMADPMDPAILEARRKKLSEMQARGGRDSTILSDSLKATSDKLGG